ncbi:MAG: AMP-binding protein, partial [Bosea sp.]|nr:AMP-binding protein [Bosea sp. (in: a-proteobacteria)]
SLDREEIDLCPLINETVRVVSLQALNKDVKVETKIADSVTLNADRRAIKQILINLLSNAVKFTDTGGRISVRARKVSGALVFTIEDTGCGIPKSALKKLGKVLVQYFGLGEVTGNITVLPPYLHEAEDGPQARIGSCGVERTGIQVQIQNDEGKELSPFETGEICVIGPAVFAGYYENPEANAKSFRDGWFRTGDLGHMDEEGFVYITGRASDMYISGGSNIYPREIEEKILTHPAIAEAAVLGVPDAVWGEIGIAVCVARGKGPSEAELAEYLSEKIPRYKMPKRFFFFEELPKSGYGKVPKRLVRDELEKRGLLDFVRAPGSGT